MTGPEHYAEAERLLDQAHRPAGQRAIPGWCTAEELLREAHVHATLAQAAAWATLLTLGGDDPAWKAVTT